MTELFTLNGEQLLWFTENKFSIEGLAFRRADMFIIHLSYTGKHEFDLSTITFDGVPATNFTGKIFLAESRGLISFVPFKGVLPGNCIALIQEG